ncbi:MAG: hypothetical protein E4G96_10605 [Chrysiogenales bacterium]|nr:MAG: hypothetical protein E4G96_10605 [Chrysiogenales bacterium]
MEPPNFGVNYCGRTRNEYWNNGFPDNDYYFVVDGSHTKFGARFVIRCLAHSGSFVTPPNIGTMSAPNSVPVGFPYSTRVADLLENGGIANYYTTAVKTGTQYWINTYPDEPSNITTVYLGPLFANPLSPGTSTFNATNLATCFGITNASFENSFTLEVVAHEGTQAHPVLLYPNEDELISTGRANYCMVGGGSGSSYYRFPVATPKPPYINNYYVNVTSVLGDVSLRVFNGPSFDEASPDLIGSSDNPGTSDEDVSTQTTDVFADGYLYVRVDDASGTGSTFVLDVIFNGF